MFIRQLEYLVTLAKEKHFAHAAEVCHVTQPALSIAIRNLEEELGVPLVKRGRRYEGLTPEGENILKYALKTLASWREMKQAAKNSKSTGEIRIGVIPTAIHVVALLTGSYHSSNIEMHQHVQTMSMEQMMVALQKFEIDLGIGYLNEPLFPGMQTLPLFKEKLVLLAKKTSDVAKNKSITWIEAAELPLCLLTNKLHNRQLINNAFESAHVTPNVVLETNSPETLYDHVLRAGLYGVVPHSLGILSILSAQDEIALICLTPTVDNEVGLISMDRDPRSPMVEAAWKQAQALSDTFAN